MFTIEKAVPVPRPKHLKNRSPMYNWGDMDPGDSFFIPVSEKARTEKATKASQQSKRSAAHNGFIRWRNADTSRAHYKIVTRVWTANSISGIRVWLMEK